jgi:hypothetical protein
MIEKSRNLALYLSESFECLRTRFNSTEVNTLSVLTSGDPSYA